MTTILVIDDDPQVRHLVRTLLEAAGYVVREATDGIAGLEEFTRKRPDLVVCDVFMPKMDGLETIRELRRQTEDLPIVAITGGASWGESSAQLYLSLARQFGATRAVPKPFRTAEFLGAISQALAANTAALECHDHGAKWLRG